jgi:hypothetical protein
MYRRQREEYRRQRVCRQPADGKLRRQSQIGKSILCRLLFVGMTAKNLPSRFLLRQTAKRDLGFSVGRWPPQRFAVSQPKLQTAKKFFLKKKI